MAVDVNDTFIYGSTQANFAALLDGREYSQDAVIHKLNVPWGNTVVIQRAGTNFPTLKLDVAVNTQGQVNALLAGLNQSGALNYWGGAHTAVLESVADVQWWDPEMRRLRLQFTITG